MKSLSCVQLFATPWTAANQAPPSMGFSRQEYWSGLPFPSPGDLPNPGIEPRSPTLQADALTSEPPGKPNLLTVSLFIVSLRDILCLMGSLYFWELILFSHFLKLLAIPFLQPDRTGLEIGPQQWSCGWKSLNLLGTPLHFPFEFLPLSPTPSIPVLGYWFAWFRSQLATPLLDCFFWMTRSAFLPQFLLQNSHRDI